MSLVRDIQDALEELDIFDTQRISTLIDALRDADDEDGEEDESD